MAILKTGEIRFIFKTLFYTSARNFATTPTSVCFGNVPSIGIVEDTLLILFRGYDYKGYRPPMEKKQTFYLITLDVKRNKLKELKTFAFPKEGFYSEAFCAISAKEIALYNSNTGEIEFYELTY